MRKNATKVIRAFLDGKPAVGDSKRTIWTDGTTLYSYAVAIAWKRTGWTDSGVATYPDGVATIAGPLTNLPDPDRGIRVRDVDDSEVSWSRTSRSQIRAMELALRSPYYFDQITGHVPWQTFNAGYYGIRDHDDEPSKF